MPLKPFEIDLEAYRKIGREGVEKYRQQAEEEEALARALEESERRKAELEARPWWQKAVDILLPGPQFRGEAPQELTGTPVLPSLVDEFSSLPEEPSPLLPTPAPEPTKSWYTRLDERLGGILPFGQPYEEGYLHKRAQKYQLDLSKPEDRAELQRRLGIEGPVLPAEELQKMVATKSIVDTLGLMGVGPVARAAAPLVSKAARAAAPLVSKAARPVTETVQKAAEAFRALPKTTQTAAKIAGGIGAGATAEEVIRGAVTPKAKEQTLPAKLGASLRAGFGDVLSLTGSVAKMLKHESIGERLQRAGEAVRTGFEAEPVEFNWKSFFDPDWYAVNVARAVPLTLSLIPAMYLGYRTGGAAGARIGLGPFDRAILGSLVGAAASRPLESAFEAAGTYEDYLAKNPGDVAGAERAANSVFWKNMSLMGLDAAQLAAAFAPVQLKPLSRLSNAIFGAAGPRVSTVIRGAARAIGASAPEALEEGLQEAFQRQAAGEPVTFDTKMKEAMAIGGLFGAGMGGVGNIVEYIRNRTLDKLPPGLKAEVTAKAKEKTGTMPPERAWEHAFDEVMDANEIKKNVIEKAVGETISELDAMLDEAASAHSRPELADYAKRPKLFILNNLDKGTIATLKGVVEAMGPDKARSYIRDFFVERYDVTPTRALELAESFLAREEVKPAAVETETKPPAETAAKEPWQVTKKEITIEHPIVDQFLEAKRNGQTTANTLGEYHKEQVQKALKEGKPVPPEVLKDYPDLVEGKKPAAVPEQLTTREDVKASIDDELKQLTRTYGKSGKATFRKIVKQDNIMPGTSDMDDFIGFFEKYYNAGINNQPMPRAEIHPDVARNIYEAGKKDARYQEVSPEAGTKGEKPTETTKKAKPRLSQKELANLRSRLKRAKELGAGVAGIEAAIDEYEKSPETSDLGYKETLEALNSIIAEAEREKKAEEAKKPAREFKPGDHVSWRGTNGEILTGTVRNVLSDGKLEVEVDQQAAAGGVPIGKVELVNPDRPDLQKIEVADEESRPGTKGPVTTGRTGVPPEVVKGKPVGGDRVLVTFNDGTWETGVFKGILEGYDSKTRKYWKAFQVQLDNGEMAHPGRIKKVQKLAQQEEPKAKAPKAPESVKKTKTEKSSAEQARTESKPAPPELKPESKEAPGKESREGVLPGGQRSGDTGEPGGAGVEGRGPEVLGEAPAENERGAEGAAEVRGKPGQGRGERAEDKKQGVPGPGGTAARKERAGLSKESGAEAHVRPHGAGVREEGVHLPAAGGSPDDERGRNYVITPEDEDEILKGGPITRARNNIEAIKVLKQLEEEGRPATVKEQKKLVKFSGWGSIYQIFEPWKHSEYRTWAELNKELRSLLTDKEYYAASRATQNAHYTSPEVIRAMWEALGRFGFDGGRILEPALGAGHFFGLMPPGMAAKSKLVGVELDQITGKIARFLYPEANVYVQGFEETVLPDNFFDVAISNVPFGDIQIADSSYPRYLTNKIHNYFFVKALDKVRPGGLIVFITSTGTMDARTNRDVRKYLASKADFIGAVRLPGSTFREVAKTDVTTDIIVLKKRTEGQEPSGEAWIESKESGLVSKVDGKPLYINEYFTIHPEMVLGKLAEDKLHTGRIGVELDGRDIAQALKEAFERLPEGIYEKAKVTKRPAPDKEILEGKPEIAEGTFVVRDGKVYQSVDGNLVRVEKNEAKIKGIIGLRDAALEVLKVQYNGEPDEVLKEVQGKLNKLYDEFVRKYGPIHQNLKLFEKDPHHYLLDSLEEKKVDPRTKKVIKVKKADIFTQRTIRAFQREFKAETPKEALLVSLNEEGRINWQRIAQLTGRTEEELQKELEGLVFKNPEGDWETAEEYLSGNVRMKLKVAEAAAEVDPQYRKNVEALKKVQPRDLEPHEITATLGAPWIPEEYVQEFINSHILNSYDAVRVIKKPFVNLWKVELKKAWEKNSTRNTRTWGTPRAPATALIELTLNKKTPVIYDRVKEGDTERRVINQRETDAARQKQLKLEEEFNRWFWSDPERAKVMAAKYNEIYNSLRLTSYDGSHLTFPGMNTKIQLHPHQKNAVWRIISSPGNTLVAHGVGKGKTFTMAAAIMELRRLGLAKKPMIVVPNNLLEQWPVEFKKLYPQAKVLVLTSRDLPGVFADKKKAGESDEAYEKRRNEHAQKRKAALSRIITGDWDAVIIPTHLFTRLPVSPEWERAFIEEQVRELRAVLTDLKKERDRSSRSTVKQLEKTLQNFEAKLKLDINEIKRDIVMPFEELGIDWLFVDEAHYFKNLGVTTRMSRVGGIPTSESQRALDMFMKTQWITKLNNGKGVVFATGTPITNTMAEMYNLQRYLTPDDLKELGVSHFDDWATMFGTIQTAWEISADGRTYQQKNSFRKFINLAELLKQFRSFADVVLNEQGDPGVPKLKNNKRTIITVEPSPEQEELIQQCADRLASFKHGMYDPKVDNPLKVCVDGQKIALDPRLVDPSLPENPNSKVNKAIANIYDIWQKTKDKKSTQLVFLDLSVPKSKADFEVEEETALSESEEAQENIIIYKEIKKKLISLGVPAEEIAFVHEFNTNAKKKQLNDAMNEGRIRILIGSTGKMGLGLNIQRKLIALHHLDCPWRPDELEQREGRILRQGNENEEVEIFVYGTERSFDTMRWNKVAQKARFIRQALVAGDDIRQMEDIDEVVLSYEEAKAAVSGNPLVEEKFKVDTEVARLQMARTHYLENRNQMFRKLNSLEDNFMPRLTRFLEDLKKDLERKKDVSGDKFAIEILGRTYTDRKEANEALKEALKKLPKATPENPEVREEVGSFAGFNLFIRKTLHDNMWELVGNTRLFNLFSENPIRSMEAQLGSIKNEMRRTEESIKKTEEEIAELQKEIDKPWEDQEKLNELLVRQREINLQLGITDVTTEEVGEDVPTEDETYPLTALDELRGKADVALANRVKGTPREKDVYALPLFAPQKTSVKQVARGLRLAVEREIFKKGMVVVDVGGGLYDRGTQYLAEHGITNLVYDPYARPEEHNNSILQQIKARGGADAVALNNVLNVIPKAEERADVLRFSYGLLKNGGQMVVTVYEGNRSGKGSTREFKDGTWSWQENRRLESYEKEIRAALPEGARIEKTSGAFVVTKPADEKALNIYALAERKKAKKIVTVDPIEEPSKLSPKATREISERLTRALNTAARSTRMGRRLAGMRAAYEKGPHAIKARRAYFDQWRTVGHELGHAFFFAAGFNPDPNEMAVVVKAVYPGGQVPAKTEIPEGFAEFFMLWFADNAEARKLAPNTAREMEKYLNANPEIQEVFDQCKAIAEEDLLGTPLERMRHLTVRRGARLAPATGEYEVPWWKRLTFRFADASIPLRDLYEEASSKGYDGLDPAKLYAIWGMAREQANQLFAGKPRFKWGGFVLPGKRSLQEIVEEAAKRPNGVMLFNDIYKALRYQERAEKGFVTPYPKEEFDKIVEQAEKDYPDLVKLVKEYAENLSEINLRLLVAGEVVSEETADRIRKGSKYYLPLYYPAKGQVRGTAQDPMRSSGPGVLRYKGHTAQTLDFIEATLLRLHDTIQAVEINRMMKTIEESLKMPEMGRFGVFIERPVTVRGINLGNLTRQIEDNFLGELDPDDEGRVVRLFMPGLESDLKKSEPVVVARHGDKQVFMRLAPDLFEAVQSMRPIQYNWLMKVLTMLAQVSRFGALANIRYLTNAFVRDVVASGIQSKTTFERSMIKGFVKGALTAAGLGKDAETLFDLYIQSGAYGSAVQEVLNSMRRSVTTDGLMATPAPGWKRTAKNIFVRIVNAPMDALRILEEAPRIPEFEAVLKKELAKHDLTIGDLLKGNIPEDLAKETEKALIEAAYASREVVVNFGLAGTSMGWRKYTRTVPFLQGSVQGIYRAYRQIKTDPAGTMVRWLVYVLPVTLIAWALSHDDDRYKDMPSDARDAYWWFPVGKATFIALAKPYEYALPANILERFLDWLADSDDPNRRKPLEDLIAAVKKSFGVQPTSMVVNTIWDLARNKTFYGSPIVPQREMQVSPEYRYGPETKKASIKLAQIAALFMGEKAPSPRQIDYFMRGAFGGAGETFLDLLSLPLKGPGSEKRAGIEYVPIVGPLLYGPAEGGSRIVDRFYKDYDRAQKLYNDYRLHGKELSEREARLVAAIPAMRAIADNLANLRRELREIEMDPNTTPERKRQARLRYNWISRMAAGYLYGAPVPEAPPETGFTEAHVQDYLRHYDGLVEKAIKNAKKKPGGPV